MLTPNNHTLSLDPQGSRAHTPSHMPPSSSKYYHPYFTPAEIEYLSEKQRGKLSVTLEEKARQTACTFIETIGIRVGFPRKTIATAQILYHRFHLFFPRNLKDIQYYDVALAALYVSTKVHDTLKKPRELLAVSYSIRFPELAAKSKHPAGEVDLDAMDSSLVESDRQRLLAVERLMLETICFNFNVRMPFPYVIKLGKELKASKTLIKLAWRISIDSHRTLLPLIYPPHSMALGSIYVACLLHSFEQPLSPKLERETPSNDLAETLNSHLQWESQYHTRAEDLQEIAHTILDLLIQYTQTPSASTSPSTPSSPSPNLTTRDKQGSFIGQQPQYPYKADQLIRLKIAMREHEHPPRKRRALGDADPSALYSDNKIGQNEGTVRFLFFPPGFEDGGEER